MNFTVILYVLHDLPYIILIGVGCRLDLSDRTILYVPPRLFMLLYLLQVVNLVLNKTVFVVFWLCLGLHKHNVNSETQHFNVIQKRATYFDSSEPQSDTFITEVYSTSAFATCSFFFRYWELSNLWLFIKIINTCHVCSLI